MEKRDLSSPTIYSKYSNSFTNTAKFFSLFEKGGLLDFLFRYVGMSEGTYLSSESIEMLKEYAKRMDVGDRTEVYIDEVEKQIWDFRDNFEWNELENYINSAFREILLEIDKCKERKVQYVFVRSIIHNFSWMSQRYVKEVVKGVDFVFDNLAPNLIKEALVFTSSMKSFDTKDFFESGEVREVSDDVYYIQTALCNLFQTFLSILDYELLLRQIDFQALEDEMNIVITWRKDSYRKRMLYVLTNNEQTISKILAEALPKGKSAENNADIQQGEIIPKDMFPDRVKNYFQLAADKGYLSQKEDGYTWHKSKVLCACFCGLLWAGDKYQLVNNEYIFIKGYNLPEKECNRIFNQNTLGASRLQVNGISPRGFKEMIQDIFLVKKNDS